MMVYEKSWRIFIAKNLLWFIGCSSGSNDDDNNNNNNNHSDNVDCNVCDSDYYDNVDNDFDCDDNGNDDSHDDIGNYNGNDDDDDINLNENNFQVILFCHKWSAKNGFGGHSIEL